VVAKGKIAGKAGSGRNLMQKCNFYFFVYMHTFRIEAGGEVDIV